MVERDTGTREQPGTNPTFTADALADRNGQMTPDEANAILRGFERRQVVEHLGDDLYRLTPYGEHLVFLIASFDEEDGERG